MPSSPSLIIVMFMAALSVNYAARLYRQSLQRRLLLNKLAQVDLQSC